MVEGVPRGAAGDEPGRAPRASKLSWRAGAAGPDLRENPSPDSFDGSDVLRRERPLPEPEHPRVEHLSFPHMSHDLVAVPATATRAPAQRGRRGSRGLLKEVPCRLDQRGQPLSFLHRYGFAIQSGRHVERAEVGRRGPGDPLHDLEISHDLHRIKREAGPGAHLGIPRRRSCQRREGRLLAPALPAPPRPLRDTREDPPLTRFQVNLRHPPILLHRGPELGLVSSGRTRSSVALEAETRPGSLKDIYPERSRGASSPSALAAAPAE